MGFQVLGGVELRDGTDPVALGPTPRLLLAVLVAHRRQVVSVDALADALWGADPPATARATLQTHVSRLRTLVQRFPGTRLATQAPGYVLDVPREQVDADRFADAVEAALAVRGDPSRTAARLDEALTEWHGPAFAGMEQHEWARPEAVRLDELHLVAREERAASRLDAGEAAEVIGDLEAFTLEQPLRERSWGLLMRALHRSGRQAEALRTAHRLRQTLGEELGLEPSSELQALEQAIAADDPSLRGSGDAITGHTRSSVQGAAGAPARTALPRPTTELLGRADDLERLQGQLGAARILTLTGPGGVGKSRLAYELAARRAGHRPDGVRLVELAPIVRPDEVTPSVAAALDVQQRSGRTLADAIAEVLGPLELLLVLDNCEHVIDGVATLVDHVVRWCPHVQILATSREPMRLAGEVVWPVAPLPVPTDPTASPVDLASSPAVQVFRERASAASPGFHYGPATATDVAELCIRLDGVPLALELAAARMGSMSPRQLADRLDDRFRLLDSPRALDRRHRSLLDVVQWSYELLDDAERTLFERISVFAGGFGLEAAEATCADDDLPAHDIAARLAALADKSLVVVEHRDDGVRFRQLETLRHYGARLLAERPGSGWVAKAHAETFTALAELAATELETPGEALALQHLDTEFGNLRAAVRTATESGEIDLALRLTTSMREFGFRRLRDEVVGWADALVAAPASRSHPLFATALAMVAYGCFVRGELRASIRWAEQALETTSRSGHGAGGLAERALSNAWFYLGEHDVALGWMARMREAAEATGVDGTIAHARYMGSVAATSLGDLERGRTLAARALESAERSGSQTAHSQAQYASGLAAAAAGDRDAALAMLDAAVAAAAEVGNRWMKAFAMTEAMWLRARRGELEVALDGYREVVETWFRGGDWANQWLTLRQLAAILASCGHDEQAAILFGAVEAAGAASALPLAPTDADAVERERVSLVGRLGERRAAQLHSHGARMRDDAVVAHALEAIAEAR